MLAAWAALFGAALTVAACYAAGALVLRRLPASLTRAEQLPLAFILGAACLHLTMFATLAFKIAYKPVLLVILSGVIVWHRLQPAKNSSLAPLSWNVKAVFWPIFSVFTVLYFVNAWAPEASADGSGYHLELVARYLRARGFEQITTNMYAGLGQGIELLFVPAFAFGRHSAAALVHFAFTIALALAIFAYGRRIEKPWAGAAGALLTYLSPVVGRDGTTAYIDVGAAAIAFAVFYWLQIWDEQRNPLLLIPVGLLAGYAYAAKYTAFVMVIYALGFVAWRERKIRSLALVGVCAALMIAPWMIKNWVYLQNPIAPFGDQIFRNANIHALDEQSWAEWLRRYDVENKWTLPVETAVSGAKTQGVIGPVFLAAPLALLSLRYREARRLLLPGCLLLATYLGNVGTRFLIPSLPFFALAMAMALGNTWLPAVLVVIQAATSWPAIIPLYANQYVWRIEGFPYKAALRITPEDEYLRRSNAAYAQTRMVEENVPRGERVLSANSISASYTSREILVSFQGAFNAMLMDGLSMGWLEQLQPTREFVFRFPGRTMQRIRVLQTATGHGLEQWNVHELRFLDLSAELLRRPEWRLRAFPNPWEVQLAFDNSPVTRWRSAETGAPGMYIDVDFGHAEQVDEVRMETSKDYQWPMRLQLETLEAQTRWTKVAENPEERPIQVPGSMRRAATNEMRMRGVNYLLVQDGDSGADDYRDDPEAWGLMVVAKVPGATLYRVVP